MKDEYSDMRTQWEMDINLANAFIKEALELVQKHFPKPLDGCFYTTAFLAWLVFTNATQEGAADGTKQIFDHVYGLLKEGRMYIEREGIEAIKETIQ